MDTLALFHTLRGSAVIVAGEGEAAEAKARLVRRAGGVVTGTDDPTARLAFVAGDHPEVIAAELRRRGVLVNVVDRPELSDFLVPSLLERGPVTIAVGTGGASAGLAKALRLRLEAMLPQALGELAEALRAARGAMRERFPAIAERRRALDAALAEGGALDPLAGHGADAVAQWLEAATAPAAVTCEFTLDSSDPDDLTLRAARALGTADRVVYEPDIPEAVLVRARADATRETVAPGGFPPPHPGNTVILRRARAAP